MRNKSPQQVFDNGLGVIRGCLIASRAVREALPLLPVSDPRRGLIEDSERNIQRAIGSAVTVVHGMGNQLGMTREEVNDRLLAVELEAADDTEGES